MCDRDTKASNLACLQAAIQDHGAFIPLLLPFREDEVLRCLGIPPDTCHHESFKTSVDPGSAYAKAPRPAHLPGSCPVAVPDDAGHHCQELVSKLWNGEFAFRLEADIPRTRNDSFSLCVWACSDESEEVNAGVKLVFGFSQDNRTVFRHVFSDRIQVHLSKEDNQVLAARVLHQFLRQFGWMLPWTFLDAMFRTLSFVLIKTTRTMELVDLCLIKTDLMLHVPGVDDDGKAVYAAMSETARALEMLGHLDQAEDVYLEIAERHDDSKSDGKAMAYAGAGIAALNATRYDASLQHLLNALKIMSSRKTWNWNDKASAGIIARLVTLHQEVHKRSIESRKDEQESGVITLSNEEKLFPALACLLIKAGFEAAEQPAAAFARQDTSCCMDRLKPEFRKRKQAKQLLIRLLRTGSVETYKEGLLSAMPGEMKMEIEKMPTAAHAQAPCGRSKSYDALRPQNRDRPPALCHKCGTGKDGSGKQKVLMSCPCQTVRYCSKSCQAEDWKRHRSSCPLHLAKKREKKEQEALAREVRVS